MGDTTSGFVHVSNREWTPMNADEKSLCSLKRMEQANELRECDESSRLKAASTHPAHTHTHLAPGHRPGGSVAKHLFSMLRLSVEQPCFARALVLNGEPNLVSPPVDHRGLSERGCCLVHFIFHSQMAVADVLMKRDWSEILTENF